MPRFHQAVQILINYSHQIDKFLLKYLNLFIYFEKLKIRYYNGSYDFQFLIIYIKEFSSNFDQYNQTRQLIPTISMAAKQTLYEV